jgi:hypothetical protein
MANEIRMSKTIEAGDAANGEVLKLTISKRPAIPEDNPGAPAPPPFTSPYTNETRVYSVADSSDVWQGPKTVLRGGAVLVDAIKAPTTPPTCPTGSTLSPSTGGNGFYACIYTDKNKADLYLYGKISDDSNDPNYNKPMEVKRTVFTRATD